LRPQFGGAIALLRREGAARAVRLVAARIEICLPWSRSAETALYSGAWLSTCAARVGFVGRNEENKFDTLVIRFAIHGIKPTRA
jgi:hypothetical protein